MFSQPRPGYTLPVFACASAVAALLSLHGETPSKVSIDLINPNETVTISIEQVGLISPTMALAITRSAPGDNLDLTRDTPVWAIVELVEGNEQQIMIVGGEGIGKQLNGLGVAAIYSYAHQLLQENLQVYLAKQEKIKVTLILPSGRRLAERTSNAAFGVVEGLSLLGTTGISQPLSAPGQLEVFRQEVAAKASKFDCLVFCVGENGLDLAQKLGINPEILVKTANWLGPLLVEASMHSLSSILLFGYHGKLIKLAGGIFHTHHHLADGRLEILTAHLAIWGLPTYKLQKIFSSPTTEAALQLLREWDMREKTNWSETVYQAIANQIDQRSSQYIRNHSEHNLVIGTVLFDKQRSILAKSDQGTTLLAKLC